MEVQPINIQLNTSTDDESETENSFLQEASSSTPKTPPGYPVSLLDHSLQDVYPVTSDLTPSSKPFQPYNGHNEAQLLANQAQDVSYLVGTEFLDAGNGTDEHTVPDVTELTSLEERTNEESYAGQSEMAPLLDMSMVQETDKNFYDAGNYAYMAPPSQYCMQFIDPASQYYNHPLMFGNYMVSNPVESESTMSMSTIPGHDLGSPYQNQYPESSQSELAMCSNDSPAPTEISDLGSGMVPSPAMIFPSLYVSSAGLLTVFLKHDVAVEMTLDRAIRVVNNRHRAVAATNNSGNASCIHHPAAKVYQDGSCAEAELFWDRHAKMTNDRAVFACGHSCFQLTENGMQCALPEFSELCNDMSVTLLFSSSGYGPHLTKSFEELASKATYRHYRDGGTSVWINGIKINQNSQGDVKVTAGRKFIRASPVFGSMFIETPFIQTSVEMNWNVKIQRGDFRLSASFAGLMLSDGTRECGFDQYQHVFIQPATVHKQPIIRNGVSVIREPWGPHNKRQNRYECNRYYYNRYQNYCSMNYNSHNNHRSRPNGNSRYKIDRVSSNYSHTANISRNSSPNSLHNSSTGANDVE